MPDFRSDTVTKPTAEMRKAMAEAEVGDDVFGEDPTVRALQERCAWRLRKEAGLFFPSGTMANQVAIKCWTEPGDEILLERRSHIMHFELAAPAVISGVVPRTVEGEHGIVKAATFAREIRPKSYLFASPGLIVIENSTNLGGGYCYPFAVLKDIRALATEHGIPLHIDGARLWNASVAQKVEPSEIAAFGDSVMVSLSKGLAAPVGAVLCGPADFLEKARKWRKLLGGGMRQAGILAAAGIVGLEKMIGRLAEDHANAKALADGLKGTKFRAETPETNILLVDTHDTGRGADAVAGLLAKAGVLAIATEPWKIRFVTHCDVGAADVAKALEVLKGLKL